ncbi:hypothetical protein [Halarsenatibacter silvermanii]|nr:hypothetical protein [Halarsenatibacter silvermanii]
MNSDRYYNQAPIKMNQEFARDLLDELLEIYIGFYREYIDAVGDYVHIFALTDSAYAGLLGPE